MQKAAGGFPTSLNSFPHRSLSEEETLVNASQEIEDTVTEEDDGTKMDFLEEKKSKTCTAACCTSIISRGQQKRTEDD